MVQFLKAKQTSFLNKPVGVVGVDTGAKQLGQTIASTFNKIGSEAFARAASEEKLLGESVARSMKIDIRDENNKLQFKELDGTLSAVARASAEPIVRQRYAEALRVDIGNEIQKVRQRSRNSQEFKNNIEATMSEYVKQVNNFGGKAYEGVITQDIARISSQHYNDMSSEEFKESLIIAAKNKQYIIESSKNDYITAISDSVVSNNQVGKTASGETVGGIKSLSGEINASQFIINKLIQENDDNLTTNNQNPSIHGASFRSIKQAKVVGLMKGLIQGKNGEFIRKVRRNILFGEDTGETLNDYEKQVLELIRKENQDDAAIDTLTEDLKVVSNDEANKRAVEGYNDKVKNKLEKEIQKKSGSYTFEMNDQEKSLEQGNNVGNQINQNDGEITSSITETIKKDINTIISRRNFTTTTVDGQTVGYKLTSDEVTAQASAYLRNVGVKVLRNNNVFQTASDYENLANALTTGNESALDEEQKKVMNKIKTILETPEGPTTIYKKNFIAALNDFGIKQLKQDQNEAEDKKLEILAFNGANGLYKHSSKNSSYLDRILGTNINYFTTKFAEDLRAEEESPEREKAEKVALYLSNGAFPKSFLDFMAFGARDTANAFSVDTALQFFKKYTNVEKSGGTIDKLAGVLDKKTYNILSAASSIVPLYKGRTGFGIPLRNNQRGLDSGQIMQKLIETEQQMDINTNIFKSNLNAVSGDNSITNSFQLLMTEGYGFDAKEAQDLKPVMDIMIQLGVPKTTIDAHFNLIKDSMYPDGEGTIVDTTSGGNILTRSPYSLLKMIPDDNFRSQFRIIIHNELSAITGPVDATGEESKFYLNWRPNFEEKQLMLRTTVGERILKERRDLKETGTAVYLQPNTYGPDNSRVRYMAFYKDNNGFFQPVQVDGVNVVYDLNEVMRRINPDFGDGD